MTRHAYRSIDLAVKTSRPQLLLVSHTERKFTQKLLIHAIKFIFEQSINKFVSMPKIIFAVLKERKTPPDHRVPLTPEQCVALQKRFPDAQMVIESSDIRVYSDRAYINLGLEVLEDISHADVMLGVKEVPVEALIPNKSYLFFSHTIKKQPYNRNLLRSILENNISLFDHETLVYPDGGRVLGFGYYAGVVGAYNGLRSWGLKYGSFKIEKAHNLPNIRGLHEELETVKLPPIKILLTGLGRVGKGAAAILDHMKIRKIGVNQYLSETFNETVYCQVGSLDYNVRQDGASATQEDFYTNPKDYKSTFAKFSAVTDFLIAGHFYGDNAPFLFSRDDAKASDFKISVVADISCDIDGPVACTIRPSTIANPFYGYDPLTEQEVDFYVPKAITVMAVDNLPCELPLDASQGFGLDLLNKVIPAFFDGDKDGILARAQITKDGKLTKRFEHLQSYVNGA